MTKPLAFGTLLLVALTSLSPAWAGSAACSIRIEDVNKATAYMLTQTFEFRNDGPAQRKHFETPGNDYSCTLAFFELGKGTMLSCEYKEDAGHTFFQSDRSSLDDNAVTNNLSFRHKSAFIVLKTVCK